MSVHRQVVERASRRQLVTVDQTTTGAVAASGWAVNGLVTWIPDSGGSMWVQVTVERTGAAVTVGATGNVTDLDVATLPTRCGGTLNVGCHIVGGGVRVAAGTYNPSTRLLRLTACAPGANVATGEVLVFAGWVPLDS
jgi:hypothetical protein